MTGPELDEAPIGLVVPPAHGRVPADARALHPGVPFIAHGLGVEEMTATSFDRSLPRLEQAVSALVTRGAGGVSVMGTSLSFYRGRAGNEELLDRVAAVAPDLPRSTMSTGVVRQLQGVDAARVVVLSAYSPSMVERLQGFLREHDIDVIGEDHLGIRRIDQLSAVGTHELVERGRRLLERHHEAQALVISCGGLDARAAARTLEKSGTPVITSSEAGLADIVGRTARHPGPGAVQGNRRAPVATHPHPVAPGGAQ